MLASDHKSVTRAKIKFFAGLGVLIGLMYHSVLARKEVAGDEMAVLLLVTCAALAFDYLKLSQFLRTFERKARNRRSPHAAVRSALEATLKFPLLIKIFGRELLTLYYAFFAKLERRGAASHHALFSYAKSSNAYDVFLFVALSQLPFLPFIHLFLEHKKGPAAAWAVTLVTLWSVIWYLAQVEAVRLRPIELDRNGLKYRFGLFWEADIPLQSIRLARPVDATENLHEKDLFMSPPGSKRNVILEFETPVEFRGPWLFSRRKTKAAISLDEPAHFIAQLALKGVATGEAPGRRSR